ncbi:hypothetical protein D3C78_1312690 [compost metagenome]
MGLRMYFSYSSLSSLAFVFANVKIIKLIKASAYIGNVRDMFIPKVLALENLAPTISISFFILLLSFLKSGCFILAIFNSSNSVRLESIAVLILLNGLMNKCHVSIVVRYCDICFP